MSTKRERRAAANSLVIVLKAMVGMRVRIDLKNDTVLVGRLEEVEDTMGMKLTRVKRTLPEGEKEEQENVILKGSQIRYVHIPDAVNIPKLLEAHENKLKRAKGKARRPKHA
eukprot:g30543.t1